MTDIPERLAHSIPETARLLDVSESTVRRLIADGALKAVRIRGYLRVPRAELYRLLEMEIPMEMAVTT